MLVQEGCYGGLEFFNAAMNAAGGLPHDQKSHRGSERRNDFP